MAPLPAPAYGSDDDGMSSSSSSTDSDDEFLTMSGGKHTGEGSEQDREAIVRKKLLESFYGAAVSAVVTSGTPGDAARASGPGGNGGSRSGRRGSSGGPNEAMSAAASAGGGAERQSSMGTSKSGTAAAAGVSVSSTAQASSSGLQVAATADQSDLDSPNFSASLHTVRHVRSSNVKALLEADESLALDIRSLDSTMQTLVYENYSKFIDATDAVRNIGKSVETSEAGLARLASGIRKIEEVSSAVDSDLRRSRTEVAEKLRLRRLLSRLDALLRLPATLRTHIDAGRTRLAAKSHLSATAILGQHSAGFESLKSIEVECNAILRRMIRDLRRKLLHWSGEVRRGSPLFKRKHLLSDGDDVDDDVLMDREEGGDDDDDGDDDDEDDDVRILEPPEPPRSVAEIFECAGTLVMFSSASTKGGGNSEDGGGGGDGKTADDEDEARASSSSAPRSKGASQFDSGLTVSECKSLALDACGRHLERSLDAHQIALSERAIDGRVHTAEHREAAGAAAADGRHLIPGDFLDGMLESATLFGVTFAKSEEDGGDVGAAAAAVRDDETDDRALLGEFVTDLFSSFLGHVRAALLERSVEGERDRGGGGGITSPEDDAYGGDLEEEDDAEIYAEISDALAHLLRTVREVASGLALPEVGLDVEAASALVDQTVEMTESMVRRRVARRFHALRVRVVRECVVPFAKEAIAQPDATAAAAAASSSSSLPEGEGSVAITTARVVQIVQQASVALSDGMQLFDDAVRAILSRTSALGPSSPVDSAMVKLAVEKNARRFAVWLASVLEVVAGREDSDPKVTLEVRPVKKHRGDDEDPAAAATLTAAVDVETRSEGCSGFSGGFPGDEEEDEASVLLHNLVTDLEEEASEASYSDLTLAVAEMCRLAERSVAENMNHSIASSVAEDNKEKIKTNSFFGEASVPSSRTNSKTNVDADNVISKRFLAAASRILQLYAMNRGGEAAAVACEDLFTTACSQSDGLPMSPTDASLRVLKVAKLSSIDCANVFGGEMMANTVPAFPDDDEAGSGMSHLTSRSGHSAIKGLQLDVERMFTEGVQVFPHPKHSMEFTRNAVVATVLKVAYKAMIEQSRTCTFTSYGYKQLQVDCAFLRHMVPHYVKDEDMADGTNGCTSLYNLLSDVMLNVGERCIDTECVGVEEYYDEQRGGIVTPLFIVKKFLESLESKEPSFVIIDNI